MPGFAEYDYLDEDAFWSQVERARGLAVEMVERACAPAIRHDPKSGDCPTWCGASPCAG